MHHGDGKLWAGRSGAVSHRQLLARRLRAHCGTASMLFLVFSSEDRSLLPDGCAVTLPGLAHSVSGSWNTPPVDCVVAP